MFKAKATESAVDKPDRWRVVSTLPDGTSVEVWVERPVGRDLTGYVDAIARGLRRGGFPTKVWDAWQFPS